MTQFVSAAAGVLLPVAVWAQDLSNDLSNGSPGSSAINSGNIQNSSGTSNGSYGSGSAIPGNSNQSSSSKSGTFSSGIMVQDGTAYVIHRLQNEMSLSDGSKIEPNGTIHKNDGSTQSIGSGQIMTMDGRIMSAPFNSGAAQSGTSSGSSGLYNSGTTPGASTSSGSSASPGYQGNKSNSGTPPATSNSSQGLDGSNSTSTPDLNSGPLNNGSSTQSPADKSDGSGLAPGATSTDPAEDYTD